MSLIRLRRPDINFLAVAPGISRRAKIQEIKIAHIQPLEDLLKKEVVDYFMGNPAEIFKKKERIRVVKNSDPRFKFYAADGNNRLYVYFALGHECVSIVPDYNYYFYSGEISESDMRREDAFSAVDTYEMGITRWSDLRSRIIPLAEYEKIMNERN